jgi:sporulation protein YlmC with PRC-barrel domain
MRIPASPVAILLLSIALSCKKDSEKIPLEPSAVYHKTSVATTAPVRLFALSGEINSGPVIQRFQNSDDSWLNSLSAQLFPNKGIIDTIRVQQGGDMALFDNFQYKTYSVNQQGNKITLTAKDTITSISYSEVYTRTIPYAIAFYKPPVFSETLVTSTRGIYGFEYRTLKQYHLEAEQYAIRAPWITGVIHYANGGIVSLMVQNKIDINFYKILAAGDTIIIREHDVVYEK